MLFVRGTVSRFRIDASSLFGCFRGCATHLES
jgi:hypothetical protein